MDSSEELRSDVCLQTMELIAKVAITGRVLGTLYLRPSDSLEKLHSAVQATCADQSMLHDANMFEMYIMLSGERLPGTGTLVGAGVTSGSILDVVLRSRPILVSSSRDHTTNVWSLETGECIKTINAHDAEIFSTAVSTDGRLLLTASGDRTVKLWSLIDGKCVHTLRGHKDRVYSASFSQDAQLAVTASDDHSARIWNLETGTCSRTIMCQGGAVFSANFSPDCTSIVTTTANGCVKLWSTETCKEETCKMCIKDGMTATFSGTFSSDGLEILTASNRTARTWEVRTGTRKREFAGHRGTVFRALFCCEDEAVLTCSSDRTARLWCNTSGCCLKTFIGHRGVVFTAVPVPGNRNIITGSGDASIRLWSVESGLCVQTWHSHKDAVLCVDIRA